MDEQCTVKPKGMNRIVCWVYCHDFDVLTIYDAMFNALGMVEKVVFFPSWTSPSVSNARYSSKQTLIEFTNDVLRLADSGNLPFERSYKVLMISIFVMDQEQ